MQITVYADKKDPKNVLETYTFSFNYTTNGESVDRSLVGVELAGSKGKPVTIREVKYDLQMMILRLTGITTFLPELPDRRYVAVHLFYTESCPPDYEPNGFREAKEDGISFPNTEKLKKRTDDCGKLDSGYHAVGLKVSYSQWIDTCESDSGSSQDNAPTRRESRTEVSRQEDINLGSVWHEDAGADGQYSQQGAERHEMPAISDAESSERDTTVLESEKSAQVLHDSLNSQASMASNDRRDRACLEQMIKPSQNAQSNDLIPTQRVQSSTPSGREVRAQTGLTTKDSRLLLKIRLVESKLRDLQSRKDELARAAKSRTRQMNHNKRRGDPAEDSSDIVSCQCGWEDEEDGMVQCEFCKTWQHLHCYGFKEEDDPALPEGHVCYNCLLHGIDPLLLERLKTLSLYRRAVDIIYGLGYPSNERGFVQLLGDDLIENSQSSEQANGWYGAMNYAFLSDGLHANLGASSSGSDMNLDLSASRHSRKTVSKKRTQDDEHTDRTRKKLRSSHVEKPINIGVGLDTPSPLRIAQFSGSE
ncbi:MAG: hypothetical protein M1819_005612 [Sarea resinae]|nr:MAG: hypothetical protein M1819_005612 [Sarea resinae]